MAYLIKDFPNKVERGLNANKKFDKFFYRFKVNSEEYRGIIDYSEKKAWNKKDRIDNAKEAFLMEKKSKKEISVISSDATVDYIVNLYLDTLPDTNYKASRESYYKRKVKPTIGNKIAADILPIHLQKLIDKNKSDGDSPRTAKQAIEVLSPAFNIAQANRIVVHNPCPHVKNKIPKSKKIVVNATERLTTIYNTIMKMYADNPYYRSFFLLALQGRRKGEIINLRWEYISFEYNYYVLPDTKNDEEQKVFLPPNVKAALSEFKEKEGWVFESPINEGERLNDAKRQTARLKKELGDWFGLHYCRNIMVSAMAERGVDSIMMSGALGHNDPNTITKYLTMNYLQGSRIASDMIQG